MILPKKEVELRRPATLNSRLSLFPIFRDWKCGSGHRHERGSLSRTSAFNFEVRMRSRRESSIPHASSNKLLGGRKFHNRHGKVQEYLKLSWYEIRDKATGACLLTPEWSRNAHGWFIVHKIASISFVGSLRTLQMRNSKLYDIIFNGRRRNDFGSTRHLNSTYIHSWICPSRGRWP